MTMPAWLTHPEIWAIAAMAAFAACLLMVACWLFARREIRDLRRINHNLCQQLVVANRRWGAMGNALQAERRKGKV